MLDIKRHIIHIRKICASLYKEQGCKFVLDQYSVIKCGHEFFVDKYFNSMRD